MSALPPWTRGPFELLCHAEGHLRAALKQTPSSDFDRRMALISFDNAIETSIATFLELTPEQRGGQSYSQEQVSTWRKNYHMKLKFYEAYAITQGVKLQHSVERIAWYHKLRNDMYHAGNGTTPDLKAVTEIRIAALEVFSTLFNTDATALIKDKFDRPVPPRLTRQEGKAQPTAAQDGATSAGAQFRDAYCRLECAIEKATDAILSPADKAGYKTEELLNDLRPFVKELMWEHEQLVRWARLQVAKMDEPAGNEKASTEDEDGRLLLVIPVLERLAVLLDRYSISYDMLPRLRKQYSTARTRVLIDIDDEGQGFRRPPPPVLHDDLIAVRVAQTDQEVYVVTVAAASHVPDGQASIFTEINRSSMKYMDHLIHEDEQGEVTVSLFEPCYGANNHADYILSQMNLDELAYLGLDDVWFAENVS